MIIKVEKMKIANFEDAGGNRIIIIQCPCGRGTDGRPFEFKDECQRTIRCKCGRTADLDELKYAWNQRFPKAQLDYGYSYEPEDRSEDNRYVWDTETLPISSR